MNFSSLAKPFVEITTHFGLVTDVSQEFSTAQPALPPNVPGVRLAFLRDIKEVVVQRETQVGGLLFGSSDVPISYFAFTLGRHAFYALFNPLDITLRPSMELQRDACYFPIALELPEDKLVRNPAQIAAHAMALADTEGREPVDSEAWLERAQMTAGLTPALVAMGAPAFGKSKWHHVYFVVPDDRAHPLYKRLSSEWAEKIKSAH